MPLSNNPQFDGEHWERIFEDSPIGIALIGIDHSWLKANKKVCEITGYSRNELLSKTFDEITHPEDLKGDVETLNQLQAGLIDSYSMLKRYISKNGRVRWISLHVQPIKNDNNELLHYVVHIVPVEGNGIKTQKVETEHGNKYEIRPSISWWEFTRDNKTFFITLAGGLLTACGTAYRWLVDQHQTAVDEAVRIAIEKLTNP